LPPCEGELALGSLLARPEPAHPARRRIDRRAPGASLHAIKLRQVRYVLAAAEFRSFRQAAAALNIEQSTISRRIRDLEVQLGASVFERSPCGVRLTSAGESFLEGARLAVDHLEVATAAAKEIGRAEAATLHLGVQGPVQPGVLGDLLRRASEGRRAPRLVLHEGSGGDHAALIDAGRLDIAFMARFPVRSSLEVHELWSERLVVAMPAGHALAARSMIAWRDLERCPMILPEAAGFDLGEHVFRRIGASADISRQAISRETLLFLVALGQGLTVLLVSEGLAPAPGVVFRPIRREVISFRAVWSRRNDKPALARLLRLAGIEAVGPPS
jgi:DNA-binding transcriptional LysR family regulator